MKKKLLSLISAALCLCMVLSACGGPASSDPSPSSSGSQSGDNTQDKTLTIATMTETTSLSPLYMGVYNYSMCTMLYETLLKYEDGEVKDVYKRQCLTCLIYFFFICSRIVGGTHWA